MSRPTLFVEVNVTDAADLPRTPNLPMADLEAIFVSPELSRATWLVTSLSPSGGEKSRSTRCGAATPRAFSAA